MKNKISKSVIAITLGILLFQTPVFASIQFCFTSTASQISFTHDWKTGATSGIPSVSSRTSITADIISCRGDVFCDGINQGYISNSAADTNFTSKSTKMSVYEGQFIQVFGKHSATSGSIPITGDSYAEDIVPGYV